MYKFSFIDIGQRDFLRSDDGDVIEIECNDFYEAEEWLLMHGDDFGWINKGTKTLCWEVENGDVDIDDI
ncbi:hypothetical protein FY557_17405 [Chryseobacterium sp. SN22]|uniref:hypothetical protein n=1 Tax=Chryseobacterium sp. SN22 TaxID=2606431 RepID=UPI0011ED42EC|nr:hypothetical protein [Chryseobacterium sp. SN22]KAA0126427.1 hypothetical protein FY557_17405 [Chryseobacterium sp. SN22]